MRCIKCQGRKEVYKVGAAYTLTNTGGKLMTCPFCKGTGNQTEAETPEEPIESEDNETQNQKARKILMRLDDEARETLIQILEHDPGAMDKIFTAKAKADKVYNKELKCCIYHELGLVMFDDDEAVEGLDKVHEPETVEIKEEAPKPKPKKRGRPKKNKG